LRKWKIFEKEGADTKAVKVGFNWWAFSFHWIWGLSQKLWWVAFGCLFFLVLINIIANELNLLYPIEVSPRFFMVRGVALLMIGAAMLFTFGIKGNKWVCDNLENKGYRHIATIEAETAKVAADSYIYDE
tara:strand:+ start:471 stop:860 length:390 start_codon:yes stop_codon:yes gene_type:complete